MERTYALQNLSIQQLSKAVDEVWTELQTNESVRAAARAQGIEPDNFRGLRPSDVWTIKRLGAGFDAATTAIIVSFAPVAAKIAADTWDKFILPRLLRAHGEDTLVKPRSEQ